MSVEDDQQRLAAIERVLRDEKNIRDMHIRKLLDYAELVHRRYNALGKYVPRCWPKTWTSEDIEDALSHDGSSIRVLIHNLFAQDVQHLVAFATTAGWAPKYYSERNMLF